MAGQGEPAWLGAGQIMDRAGRGILISLMIWLRH